MRRVAIWLGVVSIFSVGLSLSPFTSYAQSPLKFWDSGPPTLADVGRMIDHIQHAILNQGTVVIKQPDVWSQARMTKFRKEFEDAMFPEVNTFNAKLAARIARSDSASLQSQTSFGAALDSLTPGSSASVPFTAASGPSITAERDSAYASVTNNPLGTPPSPNPAGFTLLNNSSSISASGTGGLTPGTALGGINIEPNVYLDEKADYLSHLHRIRRKNLGDDNSDSAGYSLYLLRIPISIQPGDKTKKGFGAIASMTMRHDFGPRFLPLTYRNLVINDLVDILAPYVHELIRNGRAEEYHEEVEALLKGNGHDPDARSRIDSKFYPMLASTTVYQPVSRTGNRTFAIAPTDVKRVFVEQNLLNLAYAAQETLDLGNPGDPANFPGHDLKKVRMTDVRTFLKHELEAAYDLMEGRIRDKPELAILDDVPYIENLADSVYARKFEGPKGAHVDDYYKERNQFYNLYESFAHRLPGNLRFRPLGILAWGIAIEAGLMNRQLQEHMQQVKGAEGFLAPPEVMGMQFYVTKPSPEVVNTFQEYVKARWPMITFALEPFTDEQNIEDDYSRVRNLQLAIAFALSSGRLTFRQAITFTRQLQYEAQTIALNQTVASFAHGTDTFGWRFSPRYQNPPDESNMRTVTNLLIWGGPGPNYGIKNSKLEPGMRELSAVVVMPSFVRAMRLDVSGDWFRLNDPEKRKIHTARTIELGQLINEARSALELACKGGQYRAEDVERLRVRLHQLEVMLPLQTQFVNVPYENTLGGFALFTEGVTALVPEISGYEGVEYLDTSRHTDILVFGKHFGIYENAVIVGGKELYRQGVSSQLVPAAAGTAGTNSGNPQIISTTVTPLVNPANGNVTVLGADNKAAATATIGGTYEILSREVMSVRIPPGVYTSRREDGTMVVELYLSTPTGISNRLQIPVSPNAAAAGQAADGGGSYVVTGSGFTINANSTVSGASATATVTANSFDIDDAAQLQIQPVALTAQPPAAIDISLTFNQTTAPIWTTSPILIKNVPYNQSKAAYIATKAQLKPFVDQLFAAIGKLNFGTATGSLVACGPTGQKLSGKILNANSLSIKFATIVPTSSLANPGTNPPVVSSQPARDPGLVLGSGREQDRMLKPVSLAPEPSKGAPEPMPSIGSNEEELSLPPLPRALLLLPQGATQPPVDRSQPPPAAPTPGAVVIPSATATPGTAVIPGTTATQGTFVIPGTTEHPGLIIEPLANGIPGLTIRPSMPGGNSLTLPPSLSQAGTGAPQIIPQFLLPANQRPPTINVTVPIANIYSKRHQRANSRPIRAPLYRRLMGQP